MTQFGASLPLVRQIWRNMGHRDGDAFDAFWAEQNRRCGRPIPGTESQRRYELIKKAQNGERVSIAEQITPDYLCRFPGLTALVAPPREREPGDDDAPF